MTRKIGRLHTVWIAPETTRGTAETTGGIAIPVTSLTFAPSVEYTDVTGAHGQIADSTDSQVTRKTQNISFDMEGYPQYLYTLLRAVTGAAPVTTTVTTHTYNLANTNTHNSFTIGVKGLDADRSSALCMLDSVTFSQSNDSNMNISTSWVGKVEEASTVPTASFTAASRPFTQGEATFLLGDLFSDLSAADPICVRSMEMTVSKNVEADFCTSSVDPTDINNQTFTVEGSVTLTWNNSDTQFRGYNLNGTKKATRLRWAKGTEVLSISMHSATFTSWEPSFDMDSIMSQTVSFKGHYSLAQAAQFNMILVGVTP